MIIPPIANSAFHYKS
jgi:hypothetical protein